MTTGRNEPCPCGSGKKYKRCCLAAEQAAAPRPSEATRLREALFEDLWQFGRKALGDAAFEQAAAAFGLAEAQENEIEVAQLFAPWFKSRSYGQVASYSAESSGNILGASITANGDIDSITVMQPFKQCTRLTGAD